MRLLIHVGLPKTGTSSLQAALLKGPLQPGVHYCHFYRAPGLQSRCFANTMGLGRDAIWDAGPRQFENRSLKDYAERLRTLADTGCRLAIISDETLAQVDHISADRFRAFMDTVSGFATVEVMLVFRPWFAWLESMINQSVKSGGFDFADFDAASLMQIGKYPLNTAKILSFYRGGGRHGIGAEQVRVHGVMASGDSLAGFEATAGEAVWLGAPEPRRDNQSPGTDAALRAYFERKAWLVDGLAGMHPTRFLSAGQVDALYGAHGRSLDLVRTLTGGTIDIDDYETFRRAAPGRGAIDLVNSLFLSAEGHTLK